MKTALESLDALEALARKMAAMEIAPTALGMISGGLVYAPVEHYREARAIVSELPEPVDPDLVTARSICDMVRNEVLNDRAKRLTYKPDHQASFYTQTANDDFEVEEIVTALRRAREEGVR